MQVKPYSKTKEEIEKERFFKTLKSVWGPMMRDNFEEYSEEVSISDLVRMEEESV